MLPPPVQNAARRMTRIHAPNIDHPDESTDDTDRFREEGAEFVQFLLQGRVFGFRLGHSVANFPNRGPYLFSKFVFNNTTQRFTLGNYGKNKYVYITGKKMKMGLQILHKFTEIRGREINK